MRPQSFADALDDALRRETFARPLPSASAASALPPGAAQFLFARPLTSAPARWPRLPVVRPPRPSHRLTAAQQSAFDRFAALGASLAIDFDADELRTEYRRLAQRYHPDRHPGAPAAERERMTRGFSDAAASYRCLRALVEPRH